MSARSFSFALPACALLACVAACVMDPVAAGLEAAEAERTDHGLRENSAVHRPGSDCMACHGPRGSADSKFEIAGTIYWGSCDASNEAQSGACDLRPVWNAEVRIRDANKGTRCVRTNCAGNFFIRRGEWSGAASRGGTQVSGARPKFPLLTSVSKTLESGDIRERFMVGHISRSGSCNECHRTAGYWNSPGQVRLYETNAEIPADAQKEFEACKENADLPVELEDCAVEEQQ